MILPHALAVIAWSMMLPNYTRTQCIPLAASQVEEARAHRKSRGMGAIRSGCSCNQPRPGKASKCIVPCSPESMRATTEAKLRSLGLFKPRQRLSMKSYIMARNIGSEAGSRATGAEKLVMGEALVHRARESGKSFAQIAMYNGTRFAAQMGRNPAVATARDPFWEDIVAAELVLSGRSGNLGRGATHYFSPAGMDAGFRSGKLSRDRLMLYDQWTKGGDLLTWVGYVPGININRQFLLKKQPKTAAGRAESARMKPLGRRALQVDMPPGIFDAPTCPPISARRSVIGFTGALMAAVALPAFLILRYGRA